MRLQFRLPAEAPPNAEGAAGAGAGADQAAADAAAAAAAAAASAAGAGAGGTGTQGQADADAAAAAAAAAAAGAGGAKAPAAYTLTLPAGGRLDAEDLKRLEAVARKNDMTNDEAQTLIADSAAELEAQAEAWANETKADPELGGDKLATTQVLTKAGIDALYPAGDPHRDGFMAFLNRGGHGNNIHVVRTLARIGKMRAEDSSVGGSSGAGAGAAEDERSKKPLANRVYPDAPA